MGVGSGSSGEDAPLSSAALLDHPKDLGEEFDLLLRRLLRTAPESRSQEADQAVFELVPVCAQCQEQVGHEGQQFVVLHSLYGPSQTLDEGVTGALPQELDGGLGGLCCGHGTLYPVPQLPP